MRQLIQQRQGDTGPINHSRSRSAPVSRRGPEDETVATLEAAASEADGELTRTLTSLETLQQDVRHLAADFKEVC